MRTVSDWGRRRVDTIARRDRMLHPMNPFPGSHGLGLGSSRGALLPPAAGATGGSSSGDRCQRTVALFAVVVVTVA